MSVWAIVSDRNKAIDIGNVRSICGGGRIERFYCINNMVDKTITQGSVQN